MILMAHNPVTTCAFRQSAGRLHLYHTGQPTETVTSFFPKPIQATILFLEETVQKLAGTR